MRRARFAHVWRALRHRNYRLFFAGQGISLIGTWVTRFAIPYQAYQLSKSAFVLGLVAFCAQIPTALIAPFAGVLVDRWDRHRTIVVTQVFAALQSFALAAFALTGTMTIATLILLGAVQGVINAFDMPARQSFVRQMVDDRADLPNAIALNSSLVTLGRMLGPVVAATLVHLVGIGWCYAIDGVSYIAVVGSLLAMRVTRQPPRDRKQGSSVMSELADGFRYTFGHSTIAPLLVALAVSSTFGGAYASLLPAYTAQWLRDTNPDALGILMGCAGLGALIGVLYLAARTSSAGLERVTALCGFSLGAGLILLRFAPHLYIACPIMLFVGGALVVQWAATNTLVQSLADEAMLGRTLSILAVTFFSGTPLGAIIVGSIAFALGPETAFALAGTACLLGQAAAFRWNQRARSRTA
ncbi:MAG: MFS transporter, partial [Deltaproteobacteria bacterium]|nr:MFS transporter [Deltaproteobacteria bacterium]